MNERLSFSNQLVIGVMLFALFFGAGNLIFPASLGQNAGTALFFAVLGFLITGIGLPFLGTLAMGFSNSRSLQDLAGKVHPAYGIAFTVALYLTIGPFFALPRTGAVAYEIGIMPFVSESLASIGLLLFTLVFFGITLWLSLNPAKIVDRVGKFLAPIIIIGLSVLILAALFNPIGSFTGPTEAYQTNAFMTGFTEGYNTMDALASLVFGIIVIQSIRRLGVTSTKGILKVTAKSGGIAVLFLGLIYAGVAYIGATTTEAFGIFDNGGPVLSTAADYYFGAIGLLVLAVVIIAACLTTAIGLTTATAEYFNTLFPKISYKVFAVIFIVMTTIFANFGLSSIITYSIPVLLLLYPLAITLILLTFAAPLFGHQRWVYVAVTAVTFLISIIDGFKGFFGDAAPSWLASIVNIYDSVLPFYGLGLGWLIPFIIIVVAGIATATVFSRPTTN
ncbi:branched-chain amino acid transport system II carrier protein [Chryseomicrobium sp. FSL W7-1435]|uniref:branched-chain amino acid transport system II carrier protein n=1 Tax=Chryseomicrobium sp. FSL W7-1435 TaxID=2921704 RepID=UPI00315AD5E7